MSSEDIQRTIGSLVEGINGIRRDFKDFKSEVKETNKEHSEFHKRMDSRFEGFTKQHYQFIEERTKESKEFAERQINLVKTQEIEPLKISVKDIKDNHQEEDKDKRRLVFDIIKDGSKVGISAFVAYLAALFTLNNK